MSLNASEIVVAIDMCIDLLKVRAEGSVARERHLLFD